MKRITLLILLMTFALKANISMAAENGQTLKTDAIPPAEQSNKCVAATNKIRSGTVKNPSIAITCGNVSQSVSEIPNQSNVEKAELAKEVPSWWASIISDVARGFLDLIKIIAWPLLIAWILKRFGAEIIVILKTGLRSIKFKGFGIEGALDLGPDSVRQIHNTFSESFDALFKSAANTYELQVKQYNLEYFLRMAIESIRSTLKRGLKESRATVYVPDIVLENYLYQALNYYPAGGGAGRRFSVRYGIIGRAWRLQESIVNGNALIQRNYDVHSHSFLSDDVPKETLISAWGMTIQEADKLIQEGNTHRARPSFLCVMLRAPEKDGLPGEPVGLLYVDSPHPFAFGDAEPSLVSLIESLESLPAVQQLATRVQAAFAETRHKGILLEI